MKLGWEILRIAASCIGVVAEDSPLSHLNQYTNIPHSFLLKHVQGVCGHIRSDGGTFLSEGDNSPTA